MTKIPDLGLGTWQNTDPDQCAESVATALDMGYEHVDTAQAYANEEYVSQGIERSTVERDHIFLATKVWTDRLGYDDVLSSTEESLEKLGTDYVDLLYVHWPARDYDAEETMRGFNQLYDEGKIRNIGVSNFTPELVDEALEASDAPILANQVEMHPLLQQDEMVEYAQNKDITVVAYSPLARGRVFDIPELNEIAEKHGVSVAQVSLAWLMEKDNVCTIPKATSEEHIRDNYRSLKLDLDDEDIAMIESIEDEKRLINTDFAPDW